MPIDKQQALAEIDSALQLYGGFHQRYGKKEGRSWTTFDEDNAEVCTRMKATIDRYSPPGSVYLTISLSATDSLAGTLKSLRSAIEAGQLETYREMIHGETFSDFLEMAEHLLSAAYKDNAAVVAAATIAGGVLEQHLRALCVKYGVTPIPESLNALNTALYKKAYQSNDMKQITAWADIRNAAAHGEHAKVVRGQVELMIPGIRQFLSGNPA